MEKYGFKGTAYIITDKVGESSYMDWEDLTFLQEHGWEIGSHSVTHPYLSKLPDEKVVYELYHSQHILGLHGFSAQDFAYPYGDYDERTIKFGSMTYESLRTSWPNGLNNIPLTNPDDRYILKSVAADEITVDEVKQWIVRAETEHKWLILLFHRIDEGGDYSYTSQDFEEILKFLVDHGFQQFLPKFILSQEFTSQDLASSTLVWANLGMLFSVGQRLSQTSLLFNLDWKGDKKACFSKARVIVYDKQNKEVDRSKIVPELCLSPGKQCFEFLIKTLGEGDYTAKLFLKDSDGKEWVACFPFTIAPCNPCK